MLIAVLSVVGLSGAVVAHRADGRVFTELDRVPARSVVIVPGARVLRNGTPSSVVRARLEGAVTLLDAGTVEHVLVSGDNRESHYNEPVAMRNWLVDNGLDPADVTLDYAGFDTWDTCLRARDQFGVTEAVIVTQARHADRAVALCQAAGIDTVAFAVPQPSQPVDAWVQATGREALAKVKAWADIVRTPPAHHGGPFVGLVGSVDMPPGGHPPDWNWDLNQPG